MAPAKPKAATGRGRGRPPKKGKKAAAAKPKPVTAQPDDNNGQQPVLRARVGRGRPPVKRKPLQPTDGNAHKNQKKAAPPKLKGTWPEYPLTEESGVIHSAEPEPKSRNQIVADRITGLRFLLKQKWFPKEHHRSVNAVIAAYQQGDGTIMPVDRGSEYSYWIGDRKVNERVAFEHGEKTWMEPSLQHLAYGRDINAVISADRQNMMSQQELDNGVFLQPGSRDYLEGDPDFTTRLFRFNVKICVRFFPGLFDMKPNFVPQPATPGQSVAEWRMNHGTVTASLLFDTGAGPSWLSEGVANDLERYCTYTGPETYNRSKGFGGTETWGIGRWMQWSIVQVSKKAGPETEQVIHQPVARKEVFDVPFDYLWNPDRHCPNIMGMRMMHHDTWVKLRARIDANGYSISNPADDTKLAMVSNFSKMAAQFPTSGLID